MQNTLQQFEPAIRRGIYRRLRKALTEAGVEDEYLVLVCTPDERAKTT